MEHLRIVHDPFSIYLTEAPRLVPSLPRLVERHDGRHVEQVGRIILTAEPYIEKPGDGAATIRVAPLPYLGSHARMRTRSAFERGRIVT